MRRPEEVEEGLSTLYHALRAPRRRQVIRCLDDSNGKATTTRKLSRAIASWENDVATRHATGEPYRNVYNALSQTHLPTLSEAGIIIYDPERQTIARGVNFDLAKLLLQSNMPMVEVVSSLLSSRNENEDP